MPAKKKTARKAAKKKYSKPGDNAVVSTGRRKTGSRPAVVFPVDKAYEWGFLSSTQEDIAILCGVSRQTVNREFGKKQQTEFVTQFKKGQAECRHRFKKAFIDAALLMEQPSISIFAAKNILGWTDKADVNEQKTVRVLMEPYTSKTGKKETPPFLRNLAVDES